MKMRRLITAADMRKAEAAAMNEYKIPSLILMENAARSSAMSMPDAVFVRIFCGKGNNGADGVATARHLVNRSMDVEIVFVSARPSNLNVAIAENMGIAMTDLAHMDKSRKPDLIVDAIFGTGISGKVSGAAKEAIEYINATDAYVVSIDIPSGINTDTGAICGVAVHADRTVTFGYEKQGLYIYPGKDCAGEIVLADISIPKAGENRMTEKTFLMEKVVLEKRANDSNKGNYGKVLIICGSDGMAGAAYMATMAAVRGGAGLVTTMVPECIKSYIAERLTEAMCIALPDNGAVIDKSAAETVLQKAKEADAVLIGCGMRNTPETAYLVKEVVKCGSSVVIDADGLNSIADCPKVLFGTTITPHPKEMARLLGTSVEEVQKDRVAVARSFAVRHNCCVVLKGAATVTAYPDGRCIINTTGNPGMATGGTGDVLAGLCTACLAQGMEDAQAKAVYIHGRAGDICKEKTGTYAMAAGDLLEILPEAMREAELT